MIKGKLGLSLRKLTNLQHWILDKWGSQVPIRYIYQMIDNPTAEPYIIDSAKQIRRARINEFLEYAAGLNPDAMGAEEGVHRRNRLNWVTLEAPPQINNLLIEYVERIHPDDEAKQNELMDSLTSGKKNISLDRMIKVVRRQRGE